MESTVWVEIQFLNTPEVFTVIEKQSNSLKDQNYKHSNMTIFIVLLLYL